MKYNDNNFLITTRLVTPNMDSETFVFESILRVKYQVPVICAVFLLLLFLLLLLLLLLIMIIIIKGRQCMAWRE